MCDALLVLAERDALGVMRRVHLTERTRVREHRRELELGAFDRAEAGLPLLFLASGDGVYGKGKAICQKRGGIGI